VYWPKWVAEHVPRRICRAVPEIVKPARQGNGALSEPDRYWVYFDRVPLNRLTVTDMAPEGVG
jgi:hypothetical protein